METGQHVIGTYKTGQYVGEIVGQRGGFYVVKVLAVKKHPTQGDLHNPRQTDVPLFQERRALAYTEKANMPNTHVKPYEGEISDYRTSLKVALDELRQKLEMDDTEWAKKSIENLNTLEADYFK
ncbi:kinase-associated lipoprotein B [Paenalkalicoccus suaedae]